MSRMNGAATNLATSATSPEWSETDLVDLLEWRALSAPRRTYLVFENQTYTYAQIRDEAARCRVFLERRGIKTGSHVLIVMDNGPRFFAAFFGAQMCGAVPVPLSPKSPKERIDAIVADCSAAAIIVDDDLPATGPGSIALSPTARRLAFRMSDVEAGAPIEHRPSEPDATAFIQYTSGSMGSAKGAVISHRAVLANLRGFTRELQVDGERDVLSSMMPLFHDMGLVCFGLGALYTGAPLILFRQEAISLYHWLEGFARHRVTISGGPNIFLHLANRVVRDPTKYDLRTMRAFICGSEPISPAVVRAFEDRYRVVGKIKPAYGMAEITLCATITAANDTYRVIDDRYISCGKPLEDVRIAILTSDRGVTREPYVSGEVLIETPSLMEGYLHRPELTQQTKYGGCYCSGDIGFLDEEGRVYISGRKSNLIFRGGEKLAPSDLESIASLEPEVAVCAVVGVDDSSSGTQSVVLVVEIDRATRMQPDVVRAIARRICDSARRRIGYGPDKVVFAPKGRIPVTLNGKMRHAALRGLLEGGEFPVDVAVNAAELGS